MKPQEFINLIKETVKEWREDKAARLAAALAYYTSFSLAPMLVVIIAIAGLFGGGDVIHGYLLVQIEGLLGPEGADFVDSMVVAASDLSTGLAATIVGAITLLLGAVGVFGELQNALNTIWEVKPKPADGVIDSLRNYLVERALSFSMLIVIAFLLLVSLVVSAGLTAFGDYLGSFFGLPDYLLLSLNILISTGLITLLFALIFKYLPDAVIEWRDVWLGAAVTSILFTLGKFAIGLYLGRSNVGSTFGAAGSLAILLLWVYYSTQILFLGAEFTQVYANKYGSRIVPEVDAMRINESERAEQGIPQDNRSAERSSPPG